MNIFAARLRQARKAAGLTQAQLAEKTGITQSGYTRYERGINDPSISTLKKLSEILNVSLDWLIGTRYCGEPREDLEELRRAEIAELQKDIDKLQARLEALK
ncbi:MAG: helix-turn-helix transcriptional regulator [Selenomonadaceae bacterium]|nr:helix-turn-helix transcriptional regulator [Selenomonadaceae bacterium]